MRWNSYQEIRAQLPFCYIKVAIWAQWRQKQWGQVTWLFQAKKGGKSIIYPCFFSSRISFVLRDLNFCNSYFSVLWFWLTKVTFHTAKMKNNIYRESTMRRTPPHHRPDVCHRWRAMGDMYRTSWHLKVSCLLHMPNTNCPVYGPVITT